MIFFNNCDIRINGTGLMADAVSLSSQNSLRPIRTLGKKAQTSIEPEGSVSSDLSASYYIEVGKDLGYAEVSGMKATTNFENLTPRTIEVAGVTGSFYLKSYKLTIASNAAIKADVTYVSFEPLSGQITKKPNDLVYATGFSGLAHYWTSEIHSDVGTVNVPIFNFAYSFSANLTPIYTLGRKYPKQVLLIASEEEVNILKDQYKPVDFYGLSGCQEFDDCINNPRLRLYPLRKICDGATGTYMEFDMSGASVNASNLTVNVNDFAKVEIVMKRYN